MNKRIDEIIKENDIHFDKNEATYQITRDEMLILSKTFYLLALTDIEKRVKEKYIEDFKTLGNSEDDSRDGYFITGFINSAIEELRKKGEQ